MKKVLIVLLIIVILVAGGIFVYKYLNRVEPQQEERENQQEEQIAEEKEPIVVEIPKEPEKVINIFKGTDRPIAVMLDNNVKARPQAGLNEAYLVYEIIVEGGETRLMACFKGVNLEKIGSIRSSRHYFLDYALENSAIYVHFGWSPQAQSDIYKYKVNNINGISESGKSFWRVKTKSAPHNVVTNTEKILEIAEKKKYTTVSEAPSVLNYVTEEVVLEQGEIANKIVIPYSTSNKVSYIYNPETKMYVRYFNNKKQTDWNTEEDVTTKNIIITKARNYTLKDKENKGRQGLENIGELEGYYITNGQVIPITCTKENRTSQTKYEDMNGNEIEVNDGRTFIQICPLDSKITFE